MRPSRAQIPVRGSRHSVAVHARGRRFGPSARSMLGSGQTDVLGGAPPRRRPVRELPLRRSDRLGRPRHGWPRMRDSLEQSRRSRHYPRRYAPECRRHLCRQFAWLGSGIRGAQVELLSDKRQPHPPVLVSSIQHRCGSVAVPLYHGGMAWSMTQSILPAARRSKRGPRTCARRGCPCFGGHSGPFSRYPE